MKQIVLVEDDASVVKSIKFALQNFYKLEIFFNAEDGLEYLKKNISDVDILLVDNILPGMDGWNLAYKVKCNPRLAHLPIVMQSGRQSKYLKHTKYVDQFIEKPYASTELLEILQKAQNIEIRKINLTIWQKILQKIKIHN